MISNKTILITGGAGFIGNEIVQQLVDTTNNIIIVDNMSVGKPELLPKKNNIQLKKIDILNKGKLSAVFKNNNIDVVIHLAAIHFIPYCNRHKKETIRVNVVGTINILELMNEYKCGRIVHASSAAVYGPSNKPHREAEGLLPLGVYGKSKYLGEQVIKTISSDFCIDYILLRLFNVFGPKDLNAHLIPSIISQLDKSSISIGNTTSRRDYVWVGDVARAFIMAADSETTKEVINIGTGKSVSVKGVVRQIVKASKKDIPINVSNNRKRKVDMPELKANIISAKKILGWRPEVSFEKGVLELIKNRGR